MLRLGHHLLATVRGVDPRRGVRPSPSHVAYALGEAAASTWSGAASTASACGRSKGDLTGANPTDRGKQGSKLHRASKRGGLPISVIPSGANANDVTIRPVGRRDMASVSCQIPVFVLSPGGWDAVARHATGLELGSS